MICGHTPGFAGACRPATRRLRCLRMQRGRCCSADFLGMCGMAVACARRRSGYKAAIPSTFSAGLGLLGQCPLSVSERAPMSDRKLLMPKATAVWLVENTSLTFEQIAELCGLHVLEVKGIADGDVAQGIKGMDPISTGQLTREEIARGEEDHDYRLQLAEAKVDIPEVKTKKGPRYTPVSRRQDRPNAVLWLLRSHPELKDSQIMRLVGTTKPTIAAIRERTHWNSPNLHAAGPRDARPVLADRPRQRGQEGGAARRARAQGAGQAAAGEGRHAAAGLADHPRHGAAARRGDHGAASPPRRRSPRRPRPRRRRACSPSCARWVQRPKRHRRNNGRSPSRRSAFVQIRCSTRLGWQITA